MLKKKTFSGEEFRVLSYFLGTKVKLGKNNKRALRRTHLSDEFSWHVTLS